MDTIKNFQTLKEQVYNLVGLPVGNWAILATVESFGIREIDVKEDYGHNSLKELAMAIEREIRNEENHRSAKSIPMDRLTSKKFMVNDYMGVPVNWFFRDYLKGILLLFPIFIQIVAIIFFNYSLWTYLEFNVYQSTAVVFGVILGFILSGGYVQVIGRQTFFYWQHKKYSKAHYVVQTFTKSSIKVLLIVFCFLGALNFFFNLYSMYFMLVVFAYAFLLAYLLITLAPFHPMEKRWVSSVSISVATLIAIVLFKFTSFHIYLTHWIGIVIAIVINITFFKFFSKKKRMMEDPEQRPNKIMVAYKTYRFFFYGILIYAFFFIDRILAWSEHTQLSGSFIFLYEKNYEIGMDLGILMFFFLAGVLEYSIASFSKNLDIMQKTITVANLEDFNLKFLKLYKNHFKIFLLSALISALVIYLIITEPWGYLSNFGVEVPQLSIWVCVIASIGYLFLTWGMLNALYMFSLNRAKTALNALFIATAVNFSTGFILSRLVSYEYSVVGMLVGAIVYMMLTTKQVVSFIKNLDYNYYAAY